MPSPWSASLAHSWVSLAHAWLWKRSSRISAEPSTTTRRYAKFDGPLSLGRTPCSPPSPPYSNSKTPCVMC
ncbi:uncharacterized protein GGS22DRAFT_158377 [Annulohypoxylon maeteangense]|uniref:uncharacterized protein n=1 Tax=Annulohypoxylon maeteangense TaxID=1927788 RepID=UPI0020082A8B|nr:uncharacterized protein GGS22DRAFT_158377 [Annulohypoxylon maeteangense]KAI0886664.1 hypothetical protein GGS22DRAFT_158377 [Annulohypoxylon maeteangense]